MKNNYRGNFNAYTAGFFDGDGHIAISKTNRNGMTKYNLIATITNTNKSIIKKFKKHYGGYIIIASKNRYHGKSIPKDCWYWVIKSKKCKIFLSKILPFLRIKNIQAKLAIEYQLLLWKNNNRYNEDFKNKYIRKINVKEIQ